MEPSTHRYRAFISYSQKDRQHAKRLHSALESYRVPKGIDAPLRPDRKLGRFFRDDDEMGASDDLGAALRDALDNSENLVVVCSPHAARSKWVNREVQHFKEAGRGGRVFAVIADGVPNSGDPETECFPPALRPAPSGGEEEMLSGRHAEPLGIDLRRERFARARIRLAAGLLGVSFDSLWQRERRRAARRRAVAGVAAAALAAVIAVLGVQWFRERDRARRERVDRALVRVRDELASERVPAALAELGRLYDEGERGAVEGVLKSALAWASTPAELMKEVRPPAFVTDGPALFFVAADGSRRRVNLHQPYRRILSSDKRRLLVLGADEALALDVSDGRELARTATNQIGWNGRAFETPDGLLVVAGRFSGISNASFKESFLVFSARRGTLSVFDRHWNGEGSGRYRFIHPLAVSGDCRAFGVIREDLSFEGEGAEEPQPSDAYFLSSSGDGFRPAPAPATLDGWRLAAMFEGDEQLGLERYSLGDDVSSEGSGCVAPGADSASRAGQQPPVAGPPRPVGLGAAWEPGRNWKASEGKPVRRKADRRPPCTERRPCPVRDPDPEFGEKTFAGFYEPPDEGTEDGAEEESGAPSGWQPVTRPRGVRRADGSFDSVDNEFVHAGHEHFNAGFQSAWCRRLNAESVCLAMGTGAELHDDPTIDAGQAELTEMDLRSNTGRFIFYPRGAARGFRLYDLSAMRDVTPSGPELLASTRRAEFGPDDKRLFVTLNGRLLVFAPPPDGAHWRQVGEGVAAQIPALSADAEGAVAGLLALGDNELLVVRGSGLVSRFDWRTGGQAWGRTVGGVGEVYGVSASRNRRFLLVLGRAGARLLDTADGLVLSGVLVPPPSAEGGAGVVECFREVFVDDAGAVEVRCGGKTYRREPAAFGGDVRARLREILAEGSEAVR